MKQFNLEKHEISYIAGFLDGDGSIFCQLVKGSQYKYGYHIRISLVFYQRKDKKWFLLKLKNLLHYGFIRDRNDNMSEYVITGSNSIFEILTLLKPFLILKLDICNKIFEIIERKKSISNEIEFKELCKLVDSTALLNYSKNRKNISNLIFKD